MLGGNIRVRNLTYSLNNNNNNSTILNSDVIIIIIFIILPHVRIKYIK